MTQTNNKVFKKVLSNGLTVLVRANHNIPKVSIQLWYNVGSKDEKTSEKGIAHLIEHMIFKGTEKLSESDINMITHKLSGTCNAFTSYDYTGYLFDLPAQHWQEALPMMADCMSNCTFNQDYLNSEMKAVIQELKMYRDNYSSSMVEQLISTIFADHPYHYPIIGFKQDLWNLQRDKLHAFYKKHYIPNNATLVVVGDVDPEQVFTLAENNFGHIEPNWDYKKDEFYHSFDVAHANITLYRDVQQPMILLAFEVPGAKANCGYELDALSWILGSGKGSRLQQRLIDELNLVTELETFVYDLFDKGLFFIFFQPRDAGDTQKVITIIHEEIQDLASKPFDPKELLRAAKQTQTEYLSILENSQKQAYLIGQTYLATGDDQYLFNYLKYPQEQLPEKLHELLKNYFRPCLMHTSTVEPLAAEDKMLWSKAQEESDALDKRILFNIKRETPLQPGMHVDTIIAAKPMHFNFPQAKKFVLANGLTILYYHNPNIPTIDLYMDFKAKSHFDPKELEGLHSFMSAMLLEGTTNYDAIQLAQTIEQYGMNVDTSPGFLKMNMLSADLTQGLQILQEILMRSTFPEDAIEKIRSQMISDIQNLWDTPTQFCNQLARQAIYTNHPFAKNPYGSFESIKRIARQELFECYKASITPHETTLAIVGDLHGYDIETIINTYFNCWQGPQIADLEYPVVQPSKSELIVYHISRDQMVLAFAGLSISRLDPDFDKLILFDQIFTGGVLGSMSSRLFALREQSGLFYTIGGSLLTHTDKQPGMVYIKTIVSNDRLQEAQQAILATIKDAPLAIEPAELEQAKNAIINSLVDNFEANKNMAATFIFLERFSFPTTYFNDRAAQIANVTIQDVQKAAQRVLNTDNLAIIHIGRI